MSQYSWFTVYIIREAKTEKVRKGYNEWENKRNRDCSTLIF